MKTTIGSSSKIELEAIPAELDTTLDELPPPQIDTMELEEGPSDEEYERLIAEAESYKSDKKAKHPFERTTTYMVWPEEVVIVGVDTNDDDSAMFDKERKDLPLNPGLLDSILRYGVKKNISLRRNGVAYEVVDGRQRVLHAREANIRRKAMGEKPRKIPCRVERGHDKLMMELMISLNQHIPETPLQRARRAVRFYQISDSIEDTCQVNRITEQTFQAWMRLLEMDPEVHKAVDSGKVTCNQVMRFADAPREKQRKAVQGLIKLAERGKQPRRKRGPDTDKGKKPSKDVLVELATSEPDEVSPDFILGIRYALGLAQEKDVPGLKKVFDRFKRERREIRKENRKRERENKKAEKDGGK